MSGKILIGTASWSDPEFVRDWYPPGLRPSERLPYYAQRFEVVELNSSFYSIPEPRLAEQWARITPAGFTFNVKLHKLLSRHSCELKMLPKELQPLARTTGRNRVLLNAEIEEAAIESFLKGIRPLEAAGKLGVLLLQLSPAFSPRSNELPELDRLLERIAPRTVAVELRNRNWVEGERLDETVAYLKERQAAFVSVDAPASEHFSVMPALDVATNPAVSYLRLHGRDERAYVTGKTVPDRFDYDYSDDELADVKERVEEMARHTEVVHVIYNNNRSHYAPTGALRFRRVLGQYVPADTLPPPARNPEQGTLDL
jgi:uncharacterized protein YecE (DUF72 family)